MDKNREPLVSFRWHRDADGYTQAGERIVRRGGKMIEYDPASVRPGLHRVFGELRSQVPVFAEMVNRKLSGNPAAPFHMRAFEDFGSACLAFVNEYGFLGSDRTGADAESEDWVYISTCCERMRQLASWASLHRSRSQLKDVLLATGSLGGSLDGPRLRIVVTHDPEKMRLQVHHEPESLYAWMWLRAADDLTTGVDWSGAPCLYCMQAMGRGPGAYRSDAKFCSDAHRTYFDRLPLAEQRTRRKQAKDFTRSQGVASIDGGE